MSEAYLLEVGRDSSMADLNVQASPLAGFPLSFAQSMLADIIETLKFESSGRHVELEREGALVYAANFRWKMVIRVDGGRGGSIGGCRL